MTIDRLDRASRWNELSEQERAALTARLSRSSNGEGSPARTRVPPRAGDGPVPLSFAQQRLWFLDQLVPGNPFYNIPAVIPWQGTLALSALQSAIDELVRRHESLRTTFASTASGPVQVVHPAEPHAIRLLDLRHTPPAQRSGAADMVAAQEAGAPFDLAAGPLLRVCVVRLHGSDYRVLLTMHHIVSDGWSMSVLLRELSTLYVAALQGRPSPLPEPELQYADFAVWQRSWLSGERLAAQLDYWRHRLADVPTLELPTDFPRPEVASYRGENIPVRIEPDVTAAVRSLAAAEGATPFMVLLAAWAAVLQRATGQTDLAIGAPIANRQRPELEPLIGFFVNSLVLRIDTSDDPDGRDLIRRVKETTVEAYAHQDLPFEKLVEELRPERDLSRNPFAQVTLQLQNTPTVTGDLPDDDGGTPPVPDTKTSIFDLAFSLWETRAALVGMAQFTTDLFERDTIRQLMDSYGVLLADLVARPDTAISRLRLLTDDRRRQAIGGSAGPSMDLGPHVALHDLVLHACRAHPEAIAIVSEAGQLTYGELERWSARIAIELQALGVAPGTPIGVRTGRRPAMVACFLGILRAGCAYLPIDEDLPPRRLRAVLAEARVEVALTAGSSSSAGPLPASVREVPVPSPDDGGGGPAPRPIAVSPEHPAYVLFTSGSTGAPLGIVVPHRAIVNHMRWMLAAFPLDRRDRVLQRTPLHFDASVWEVWAPLLAGARMVLYPGRWAADTGSLVDVLRTAKVTVLQVVPSLLRLLLDEPAFVLSDDLRRVYCGGEELPRELVERFHGLWPGGQSRELINLYGPTEATIDATAWRCSPGDPHARAPIGRPIANTTAYVLDQYHEPVPIGFPGELYLAGDGLATGYVGRPELTAERFVADPFAPERRLMHRTGDLVRRRPDGTLEFLRRTDDLLKVRGVRIEPAEIERCLVEHAEVDRALVVARTGRFGDEELVAYVAVGSAADDARAERELIDEHVEDWRTLYQSVYRGDGTVPATGAADVAFDTVGWNSSYDGLPIGDDKMRSWLDETVERVLALRPRRVLEVGSGTGLIALRVAPHCEDYLALDFSGAAVTALRAAAAECGVGMRVEQRAAHELSALADGDFDVVVINSVVQYFPGLAYLEDALSAAADRLSADGTIFVGDVRSLPLLAPFHMSVVLDGASGHHGGLRPALEERLVQENELVIDPRWFTGVARRLAGVRSVVVRPKTTAHATEMTRFRYDVVLSRSPARSEHPDVRYLDWARDVRTPERLVEVLGAVDGPIAVLGVPNDRVAPEARVVAALARGEIGDESDIAALRDEARAGIDPYTAVELARGAGLAADVTWTRTGPEGSFDLVAGPAGIELDAVVALVANEQRPTSIDGAAATAPLRRRVGQRLIPVLRRSAEERLPSSMVPNRFVVLPRLPLRPNGKVDRAALPAPDGERPAGEADFVPPSGALESVLAEAWADVLAVRRVGAADDFFADLGGHSLLATQLISSVRELLDSDVPLRTVFEAPTVAKMAAAMLEELPAVEADRLQRRADALLKVRDMSDDEAEALLDTTSER